MYSGFEWKIRQRAEANIGQAESWVIEHDVAAALRAIAAVADLTALEFPQELCALGDVYVFRFPQSECAHRRGGITPACFTMAVTHLGRRAARLDFHRSAVASACMRVSHASTLSARFASRRAKLLIQKYGVANCGAKYH